MAEKGSKNTGRMEDGGHAGDSGKDLVRDLDPEEQHIVEQHEKASAKLVHEIIRQRGIEELERPALALLWSAIGAGFVIGVSPYAMAALALAVPASSVRELLLALGYAAGFIAVIAGRMQLFTESTVTAVLPLATTPCWSNLRRTLRLWAIVFGGNVLGTLVFAAFVHFNVSSQAALNSEIERQAVEAIALYSQAPFLKGIPAGFLLAVLVWSLPNAEGQEVFLIALVTGLMALAHVAHSVVGCAEMWTAVLAGSVSLPQGLVGFLLPAAAGNVVGGSVLFALLAHAQVVPEIEEGGGYRYGQKDGG